MKILHTSDIHLKEINDNFFKALETVLQLGAKEQIDVLIIAGDLFDSAGKIDELKNHLRKIFQYDFKTIILPGNHDVAGFQQGDYFGENIYIIDDYTKPIKIENINFYGIPFSREIEIEQVIKFYRENLKEKNNVLIYHGDLVDICFRKEDKGEEEEYMPVKLEYFKDLNFKYILAGHFHTKFTVKEFDENKYFVYCGSPVSITKKETGKRKVNLFEYGTEPKPLEIESFYYKNIEIILTENNEENLEAILKENFKHIDNCEVILKISGYIKDIKETELKEYIDKFIEENQIKIKDEIEFEVKNIKAILEDFIYKEAKQGIIQQEDLLEEEKEKMNQILIEAMKGI